jgi:hypothetical protein
MEHVSLKCVEGSVSVSCATYVQQQAGYTHVNVSDINEVSKNVL